MNPEVAAGAGLHSGRYELVRQSLSQRLWAGLPPRPQAHTFQKPLIEEYLLVS